MGIPTFVWYVAAFYLGIKVLNCLLTFLMARFAARPIPPVIEEVSEEALSPFHRAALSRFGHELQQLGFRSIGALSVKLGSVPDTSYSVWVHDEHKVTAMLYVSLNQLNQSVPSLNMESIFEGGAVLSTRNGAHQIQLRDLPDVTIKLARGMTVRAQFDLHLKQRSELSANRAPVSLTLQELISNARRIACMDWDSSVADGILRLLEDGTAVISTRTALTVGFKAFMPPKPTSIYLVDDATLDNGWSKYAAREAEIELLVSEDPTKPPSLGKVLPILGIISAGIFVLSFSGYVNILTVLSLLIVIFIHELGHALAMQSFGYKDVKIFFVPFIGGVAVGKADEVAAWKEAVVIFAGPIPGIVLGLAITGLLDPAPDTFLSSYATMSIGINVLNLIPFVPLDGGRIVDLLIPAPLVLIKIMFRIAGVGFLAMAALLGGDIIFLVIAGVLLLNVLKSCWSDYHIGKFVRRVRREHRSELATTRLAKTRALIARSVVEKFDSSVFATLPFVRRHHVAKQIFSKTMVRPLGFLSTPAFAALYVASFAVPIALQLGGTQSVGERLAVADSRLLSGEYETALAIASDTRSTLNFENVGAHTVVRVELQLARAYHGLGKFDLAADHLMFASEALAEIPHTDQERKLLEGTLAEVRMLPLSS